VRETPTEAPPAGGAMLDWVVEVFEDARLTPDGSGWRSRGFSTREQDAAYPSLARVPQPVGADLHWLDTWTLDARWAGCDTDGWMYATNFADWLDRVADGAEGMDGQDTGSTVRRRRWKRCAPPAPHRLCAPRCAPPSPRASLRLVAGTRSRAARPPRCALPSRTRS
jgi:hypothetical protein